MNKKTDLSSSYSSVAVEYAVKFFGELDHKPLDRQLLDDFCQLVGSHNQVCDLGCGPGQIARYLADHGMDASGIDLAPGMVEVASRLSPHIRFQQGDLLALPLADETLDGVTAFYSLIHISPEKMKTALSEIKRVLHPGGVFLTAFHIGNETIHLDEWWEKPVSIDFIFFPTNFIKNELQAAGFVILNLVERPPYPDVEHPSRRAYIFAQKPKIIK